VWRQEEELRDEVHREIGVWIDLISKDTPYRRLMQVLAPHRPGRRIS
jgi:hypothetical protein